MKSIKIAYLTVAAAFLVAFFGCGVTTVDEDQYDADKIINDTISAISAGTLEIGEETANVDGVSELTSSVCILQEPADDVFAKVTEGCLIIPEADAGDMNGDGVFNVMDILYLSEILTGKISAPALETLVKGDMNKGDMILDGKDLHVMLAYAFKGLAEFPVEPAIVTGDVDFDGIAGNIADLVAMVDYVYDGVELDVKQQIAADINLDFQVDKTDVDLLVDYLFIGNPVTALPYSALLSFSLVEESDDPIIIQIDDPTDPIHDDANVTAK